MCMSVLSACINAYHVHSSAYGGEKQALDPLELELWSTMWVPETKHGLLFWEAGSWCVACVGLEVAL